MNPAIVNFMKTGRSAAFTVTKGGKKVHYLLSKNTPMNDNFYNVEKKTLCGIPMKKGVYYPDARQSRTPDFCKICESKWEDMLKTPVILSVEAL